MERALKNAGAPAPVGGAHGRQTKIKFCGMRTLADVRCANALRADYIGFVFAKKSRRFVTDEEASALSKAADAAVRKVGVFVDDAVGHIVSLARAGVIDIAQLHGQEDAAYIRALRAAFAEAEGAGKAGGKTKEPSPGLFPNEPSPGPADLEIWQAFSVSTPADIEAANASRADLVLLDHGAGGTGERFDEALLAGIRRPYVLAGGLDSENVAALIGAFHPFAVDVSSGIETDGKKDRKKMAAFAAAAAGQWGRQGDIIIR